MKYWWLGLGCLAYAIVTLLLHHVASLSAAQGVLYATYGLASAAGFATAASFGRRDLLRWAWLSFAVGYGIAFVSKLVGDPSTIATMSPARASLWAVMILLLNVGSVTALILFTRVWSGTGVAPPWRLRATVLFVILALVIDGSALYSALRQMLTLRPAAFGLFASTAGDVINIALVGPIFATAIALRGGLLMRPWLFIFAATMCWVVDDATAVMPAALGLNVDLLLRPLAVLLGGAAAMAQLMVKREIRASMDEAG